MLGMLVSPFVVFVVVSEVGVFHTLLLDKLQINLLWLTRLSVHLV